MKDLIKQVIKEEVSKSVASQEEINESFLFLATLAGLGASWGWLRNHIRKLAKDIVFATFIEEYDQQKVIEKKIPDLLRKFKLINTLSDLMAVEKEAEEIIKALTRMNLQIDEFIDIKIKTDSTLMDKALLLNPNREKVRLKKELKDFIEKTKKSFASDIENKKNTLLG
jgi:hypothetical protein